MQYLIFHLNRDRYALPTSEVGRLLPLLELKQMPQAPEYIAGLMNLHGTPVPVLDLCRLTCGRDCAQHFSTRILLVHFRRGDAVFPLGLIAEGVSGVQHIDPQSFVPPGIDNPDARYLGAVSARDGVMLQLVDIDHLLPAHVRELLYPGAAA